MGLIIVPSIRAYEGSYDDDTFDSFSYKFLGKGLERACVGVDVTPFGIVSPFMPIHLASSIMEMTKIKRKYESHIGVLGNDSCYGIVNLVGYSEVNNKSFVLL